MIGILQTFLKFKAIKNTVVCTSFRSIDIKVKFKDYSFPFERTLMCTKLKHIIGRATFTYFRRLLFRTVPARFCDHPPSEGLRSLKPAWPLKLETGYSDRVVAKARV